MGNSRKVVIDDFGNTIFVKVFEENGEHIVTVDDVEYVRTTSMIHAAVLFNMIADHITEYVDFKAK